MYTYTYTHHIFLIHSSVDGHLCCFHGLDIVHSASMNNGIHVSLSVLVSSAYMPGVGLLGQMVVLFLVFYGISIPYSIVAISIYIPTNTDIIKITLNLILLNLATAFPGQFYLLQFQLRLIFHSSVETLIPAD